MPATVWTGARVTVWAETADRPRSAEAAIRDKGRRRTAIFPDETRASSRCDGGDSASFAAGRIARDEPSMILSRLPRIGTLRRCYQRFICSRFCEPHLRGNEQTVRAFGGRSEEHTSELQSRLHL